MKVLPVSFLGVAALVWLTSFGFLALLMIVARTRRRVKLRPESWPDVAVVVPTLNEEAYILQKLDDLRGVDYPPDRLHALVVDGGSTDRTRALVQERIEQGEAVRLVCLTAVRNKIEQVIRSLELLGQEYIVFTDADTRLEPGCVRELIGSLLQDRRAAIVGAMVRPLSALPEELIHWRLHNFLWWLEGEAFSAAGFSGVCYVLRKDSANQIDRDVQAEDIHLSLSVCAAGYRVRLCPSAVAYEMRVPQTVREFFRFRRRRGSRYVAALRHFQRSAPRSLGWRIVRRARLWQFGVTPWLGVVLAGLGAAVLLTPQWTYSVIVLAAFIVPALGGMLILNRETARAFGWGKLIFALMRYGVLIMTSLLTLGKDSPLGNAPGGQP
jgi:cellulose synthase/poly-beta-1,6-N-acetylglucosamine synthase-like glycosyltransferase